MLPWMAPDGNLLLPERFRNRRRNMVKLTKQTVDSLLPREKEYFAWDSILQRFGLRVYPSGKKVFVVQYRSDGKTRRYRLGTYGLISPDAARKQALRVLGEIEAGHDPADARDRQRTDITVEELCMLYLENGISHKKASTIATDRGRISRHIIPMLGGKKVRSVTHDDIQRFVEKIRRGETAANIKTRKFGLARVRGGDGAATRTVGLLGGILTYAVKNGIISDNPARDVSKPKDRARNRFLDTKEFQRVGSALAQLEASGTNPIGLNAIRLLMVTGCRKSEITQLKWQDVDFDRAIIFLRDGKTGDRSIPLNLEARRILKATPRFGSTDFVFPSVRAMDRPSASLPSLWKKVQDLAGLPDVRLHDLRRSFGSMAVESGLDIYMVSKLLGHRDIRTTQVYAHFTDKARMQASEHTADQIARALSTQPIRAAEPEAP